MQYCTVLAKQWQYCGQKHVNLELVKFQDVWYHTTQAKFVPQPISIAMAVASTLDGLGSQGLECA